jgi:hypothetical protein
VGETEETFSRVPENSHLGAKPNISNVITTVIHRFQKSSKQLTAPSALQSNGFYFISVLQSLKIPARQRLGTFCVKNKTIITAQCFVPTKIK